jgi:hypothetical protein
MNFKNQFVSAFAECVLNIGFSLSLFNASTQSIRQRISINQNWRFSKVNPVGIKGLSYDENL